VAAFSASRVFASNFVTGFGIDWGTPAVVVALVLIGIVLFFITMLINKQTGVRRPGITDPTHLAEVPD
jgi:hypothetical protein